MKQTIDIPEGYEFDHMAPPILSNGGGCLNVILKKKNIKNFDFYIDEYLRTDECTTNDMLCNWMTSFEIDELKNNLKKGEFNRTPWESRIGMLKFICKDVNIPIYEMLFEPNPDVYYDRIKTIKQICPVGFLESIIK